jgi:hypothetical protein
MKKYPSKISYGLLFSILAVLIGSSLPMIFKPVWTGILIMLAVLVFIGHLYVNTYYTIDGNSLIVKSGLVVHKKIDINSIKTIKETNTIFSAPALSFDRLEVKWGDYTGIVISPMDKKGFIEHMKSINPRIVVK